MICECIEPYFVTLDTCPVATGQEGFQEVKDTELQLFRSELSTVALSIKQMLDKQSPEGAPLSDDDQQACKCRLGHVVLGDVGLF